MYSNVPNLFVIGAAKSGTTTLCSILSRHPKVFMSRSKATRFFIKDEYYDRGLEWYLQTYFVGAEQYPIRGEATPSYLAQASKTAPRIKKMIPDNDLKFIAVFRNPVERAYSHYWYNRNKRDGLRENLPFEKALEMEYQHDFGTEVIDVKYSRTGGYFKNGEYSRCLKEYFKYFDRKQFLLLLLEDLYEEHFQTTTTWIAEFLNVDTVPIGYLRENFARKVGMRPSVRFQRKHRRFMGLLKLLLPVFIQDKIRGRYSKIISKPVKYPPMRLETKKQLLERYKPGIAELQEMTGRDLSSWLRVE